MRFLSFLIMLSMVMGQKSGQINPIPENQFGMSSGIFANFGTSDFEIDGFFEIQTRSGLFLETSGITQLDKNTTLNTSLGFMREVLPNMLMGGGYSNYIEFNSNDVLNEVFFGFNSKSITGVVFLGLGSELSPNYLGILNLNALIPELMFDSSIIGVASEQLGEFGSDIFFNISTTSSYGFSLGYSLSSERYEDQKTRTFTKQGHTKTFTMPVSSKGFFNTIYIGINF